MEKCFNGKKILVPRQPLMVMAADQYYKMEIMEFGISHFYTFSVSPEMLGKVQFVPDCSIDIMFQCDSLKPEAYCYGSLLTPKNISYTNILREGNKIFGVRFLPGKAVLPRGLHVASLTAGIINLSSVMNDTTLIKRIATSKDFLKQIEIFLEAYIPRYQKHMINSKKNEITNYIVDESMKNLGNIKVEAISNEIGCSTRYTNKIFHEAFGMPPKMFLKIIRFQGILNEFRNNIKVIDIADDMGFVDQSHLGREFKQFTGMTPKKYREVLNTREFKDRLIVLPDRI